MSGKCGLMVPFGQNRGTYASPNAVIERLYGKPVLVDTLDRKGRNATREVCVRLEAGANLLFVRCDHHDWQRQFSVSLKPVEGDRLDDLSYSARPDKVTITDPNAGRGVNL